MKHSTVFKRKRRGISLIEVIIDVAILAAVTTTLTIAMLSSLRSTTNSALAATGAQIANEQIESLRNMTYDALATQLGPIYPQGSILDYQTIVREKEAYAVTTDIEYVDDPYDGTAGGSPNDLNPADYKRITVNVYNQADKRIAQLSTDIASRAAETVSNTGVLRIRVLDANGVGVDNASLFVTNTTTNPQITIDSHTDDQGVIAIPNLPIKSGYHVLTSKGGYNSDSTTSVSQSEPHPTNPDATLLLQQVTDVTLTIALLSNIQFTATGIDTTAVMKFQGAKLEATNPNVAKTLFSQTINPGLTAINNVEFDSYMPVAPNSWYITTCDPMAPFVVAPNSSITEACTFTADASLIRIATITPHTSDNIANVSLDITGANLLFSSVSIQTSGGPEITVPGMTPASDGLSTSGTVDFSNVPPGTYDVIIRNSGGKMTTQPNGLILQ